MAGSALLSCLGFPGWGPLHLGLRRHGEPSALAWRLKRAFAASAGRPGGSLLAALLRANPDFEPLERPWPAQGSWQFHYRLVCVRGPELRISAWHGRPAGLLLASGAAVDVPIEAFLQGFLQAVPSHGSPDGAMPRPAAGWEETRVETIFGAGP